MKRLILIAALLLPGCALITPPSVPAAVDVTAPAKSEKERVQRAINAANLDITALAETVRNNFKSGAVTAEEANRTFLDLREMGARLDKAQAAIRLGGVLTPEDDPQLVIDALVKLRARVK